jgi:1-acyl-sn-glycerol-3-phosphate acyltransferase
LARRLPRFHRIIMEFGRPLHFTTTNDGGRPAQARRVVTDEIMQAIGELSGQDGAHTYAAVPQTKAH